MTIIEEEIEKLKIRINELEQENSEMQKSITKMFSIFSHHIHKLIVNPNPEINGQIDISTVTSEFFLLVKDFLRMEEVVSK